jgi:hypothetical protein
MAISEDIEIHLLKQSPVTARNVEDGECVHRLQALVAELLVKNELLRHQLRRDACMFERLRSLFERAAHFPSKDDGIISPLLQAYALLARQG